MVQSGFARLVSLSALACGGAGACSALLSSSGATFERVTDGGRASVGDRSAAYGACRLGERTRLHAPSPAPGAMFGAIMAASGNTLVVVAPFEPNDVTDVSKLHRAIDCTPN